MKDWWRLPWKLAVIPLACIVIVCAAIGAIEFATWTFAPELNAPRCEALLHKQPAD